jgi:hypothetical protein
VVEATVRIVARFCGDTVRTEAVFREPQEWIKQRLEVPMSAVEDPTSWSVRAMLGADSGRGTPFIQTPCVLTCCPVSMVLRDGMHTTFCGCARSNTIPFAARASMFGVRA